MSPFLKFLKKHLPLLVYIAAAVCLVGAILVFIFPVARAEAGYQKVLGIIIACLMIVLAGLGVLYNYFGRDKDPNFFLYDRNRKKNIPVEELKFSVVNERMKFFLTLVSQSEAQLWTEDVLENESQLGYRAVYRPLLAYKMLYDLADTNADSNWQYLLKADSDTVNSICRALEQGGETEMVRTFRFIMENYREDPSKIKSFIIGNTKYIRGKMMAYIKQHIEYFY